MLSELEVKTGIDIITTGAVANFWRDSMAQEVNLQRAVYNGKRDITNVLTPAQEEALAEGKDFVPDLERAEKHAKTRLEFGVSQRLKGAYVCYKAGMELECLRHILLALDTVFCALGWQKASAYINEQNSILLKMSKEEREAA